MIFPGAAQRGELRLRHQCLPSLAPGSVPRPRRASVKVAGAGCGDFQRADERHAVQQEFFFFSESWLGY